MLRKEQSQYYNSSGIANKLVIYLVLRYQFVAHKKTNKCHTMNYGKPIM